MTFDEIMLYMSILVAIVTLSMTVLLFRKDVIHDVAMARKKKLHKVTFEPSQQIRPSSVTEISLTITRTKRLPHEG